HAQRVSRGRCIDHDEVVTAGSAEARQLQKSGELVDPWQRQSNQLVHIVSIQPRAAERDVLEHGRVRREPVPDDGGSVDLDGVKSSSTDWQTARSPRQANADG